MADWIRTLESLSLGSRLKRLSDRLMQDVADIYKQQGIDLNPTCFPLLQLLIHQGQADQAIGVSEAARQLGVTQPAVSRMAGKLEKDGWLERIRDPQDERKQLLQATEKSHQLMPQLEPVWREIRSQLDWLMCQQQYPLLSAINEFEDMLQQHGSLQVRTLERLAQPQQSLEIISWDPRYRDDFKKLNQQWLEQFFPERFSAYQGSMDQQQLENPESHYLAKGGYIWFARSGEQIVGCIAMFPNALQDNANEMELSKMAVTGELQGQGIGRQLVMTALDKARQLMVSKVHLETASCLKLAMALYQNTGFRVMDHPCGGSRFPGADIYMELQL